MTTTNEETPVEEISTQDGPIEAEQLLPENEHAAEIAKEQILVDKTPSPPEPPVELEWDPTAEFTITGQEFGNLNMAIRSILANQRIFSVNDLMHRTEEMVITVNALKTCEQIVAKMKEQGIATPVKQERKKR